jgi:ATP-dependent Clp protease ATP-binding subunit ClpC
MSERQSIVTTWTIERVVPSGATTCAPVVAPELCAFGDDDGAREEVRVFLAHHLATEAPAAVARYFLPAGVEATAFEVALDPGAPTRARPPRPVEVACVLIPYGDGRDRLALVPALGAAFFVDRKDELAEVAARELARLAAAAELDGDDWRRLLPPLELTVAPLPVTVRFAATEAATAARLAAEARRRARATLDELAAPLADRVRGGAAPLVGREREAASLDALLGGRDRLAVLLCGDAGVGKTALVLAWGRTATARPTWVVTLAHLVAGASGFGEAEKRVTELFAAAEALDAALYFEDFASLFRERVEDGGLALTAIVRRFVVEGRVRVVAELTPAALARAERREVALVGAMTQLAIAPLDPATTIAALTARAAHWRRAEARRPQLDARAIAAAVELARRYLPYRAFPGKAVELLDELRAAADGEVGPDGAPRLLGADAVYDGFAAATGVPAMLLRDDRPLLAAELCEALGRRMVGQAEAVARVAEVLCTVKAQLQPADKPLATFLFAGPTGVGKTELAKRLAQLLFGDEARLVRFDMSEYADPWAAERLIRGSASGDGLLTARLRQQPFAVVLLDEIEKAHPAVHDLLLQVAGEGRLTDARGRTAYFHNAILILTSNLGGHERAQPIGLAARVATDERTRELARYRAAVTAAFRPELLNRLDAIIPFHHLDGEQIAAVARLAIGELAERRGLVQANLGLDVSDRAIATLAAGGYAAAWGARALRRHLDAALVAPLARLLARLGKDAHGALVVVRADGEEADLDLPSGAHLGASPSAHGVTVAVWRRGGAGGRRNAKGALLAAAARREADGWMARDLATDVRTQRDWLRAQLARGDAQPGAGRKGKRRPALASAQVQQLAIELARLDQAWAAATAAQGELAVVEELAIAAALAGDDVAATVAEVPALARDFARAMFWLAVARREARDEITLTLSAPEHPAALASWLGSVLATAARRGWTITGHGHNDRAPSWPVERVWGPPRDRAWLAGKITPGGGLRNILVRICGPGAAVVLGLEAGVHRFHGVAKIDPCHMVVRVMALSTEFTDEQWRELATLAAPAPSPRGAVDRVYREQVEVAGAPLEVPVAEHGERLEEIGLAVIAAGLARGLTVDELYPTALGQAAAADGDDGEAVP